MDLEEVDLALDNVSDHGEQVRVQVKELRKFYASLIKLRDSCTDGDDERSPVVPESTARENSSSDLGCQKKVYLNHDQYQALEEILTEFPNALDIHHSNLRRNGGKYTPQFQAIYSASKLTSTTTWISGGSISYDWLFSISDSMSEGLEPLLLGAEALLRLLCETVPNFEALWLKCLNALSFLCPTAMPGGFLESFQDRKIDLLISISELRTQLVRYKTPPRWFAEPVYPNFLDGATHSWTKRGDYHLASRLKATTRLLSLRFASSLFSENGRQPGSYLKGRVSAVHQDHTNLVSTRKELPMIIGGKEIKAQHDSGAEGGNFMDCDLAFKLNLRLRNEKGDCKRFSMGNGKIVKALGRVRAVCAFAKEAQTKMRCWFYVFDELASPLIMGSQFLEKTKTLSDHVHRLEDRIPNPGILPMVNLIGSTQHAKRRFTAHIDHRYTLINADSGSDLDLMSSTYVRAHGYQLDRRWRCRKRVRFADNTIAETIGQVKATLTLEDGSIYPKTFDVLPNLTSEVLLGQFTLEEINAFTFHRNSFVDVFAGERHSELSVLGYLGKVNEFLACNLRRVHRKKGQMQKQGKLLPYDLKRLGFAPNSWISIACETTG